MEIKKLSFKKRTRNRLMEIEAKGIKKFCSYDVFGKNTTPLELDRLHTALYELCVAGEIERVKDAHGNFKKIRPAEAVTPDWLRCKVMINQYVIIRLGDRSKMEQTNWARRQKLLKEKTEKKARVVSVWESIWPDMYKLPAFKKQTVAFTNQCID